jgi:hypothetical protein
MNLKDELIINYVCNCELRIANCELFCQFYAEYLQREWLELWSEDEVYQILLPDGTLQDKPTFAINACCCWGDPLAVHRTASYSEAGSSWFQWNNFTPWK